MIVISNQITIIDMSLPKDWGINNPEKERIRREKIRKARLGKPRPPQIAEMMRKMNLGKVGDKSASWKGGIRIYPRKDGKKVKYIYVSKRKYIAEHKMIMENKLKRKLLPNEVIHHKNGDTLDNRLENLRLFPSHSEHIIEEQRLNSFAKMLLYGNLAPELTSSLKEIYQKFDVK